MWPIVCITGTLTTVIPGQGRVHGVELNITYPNPVVSILFHCTVIFESLLTRIVPPLTVHSEAKEESGQGGVGVSE